MRRVQDLHKAWGEAIERELEEQHRTMAWLAREVDKHPSTILRIVRGELCPNDELKWKIAGALGKRMDLLWEWPRIVPPRPTAGVAA